MNDLAPLVAALAGLGDATAAPRLVGIGWATVDIERTVAGLPGFDVRVAAEDELLGARAWRTSSGPVALVLLEPNTEGRLAAALARRGEGITVLYVVTAEPLDGASRPTALGLPGRLLPQERPWGPFIIAVSPDPASPSVPGESSTPGRADHRP
jgi:hypothetical protein